MVSNQNGKESEVYLPQYTIYRSTSIIKIKSIKTTIRNDPMNYNNKYRGTMSFVQIWFRLSQLETKCEKDPLCQNFKKSFKEYYELPRHKVGEYIIGNK